MRMCVCVYMQSRHAAAALRLVGLAMLSASSAAFRGFPGLAVAGPARPRCVGAAMLRISRPLDLRASLIHEDAGTALPPDGLPWQEKEKEGGCFSRRNVLRAAVWLLTASTVSAAYQPLSHTRLAFALSNFVLSRTPLVCALSQIAPL